DFGGVAVELDEGQRIAEAIGKRKAAILQNHGLITVGGTVDEAVWWFITMERSCQVQLVAEAALRGSETLRQISPEAAAQANKITGSAFAGWFQFQPLYARIVKEQPDLLD
ncbi:MAG: class II aldolase/adducin family protein, partial [Roseiarcus sp.]